MAIRPHSAPIRPDDQLGLWTAVRVRRRSHRPWRLWVVADFSTVPVPATRERADAQAPLPQGGVMTAAQCRALGVDDAAVRRLLSAGRGRGPGAGSTRTSHSRRDPEPVDRPVHHARCAALSGRCSCLPGRPSSRTSAPHGCSACHCLPGRWTQRACVTRRATGSDERSAGGRRARRRLRRRGRPRGGRRAGARRGTPGRRLLRRAAAGLRARCRRRRAGPQAHHRRRAARRAYGARRHSAERRRVAEQVVERADPLAANWFESISRWWLLEAGLPRPRLQVPFSDKRGRVRDGSTC